MVPASRAHAESRFSAIEKRQQKALGEIEQRTLDIDANTARLKALRLAKAQADIDAVEAKKAEGASKLAARVARRPPVAR
jgi:hypothetical protein